MKTDFQRSQIRKATLNIATGIKFEYLSEVQQYVDGITQSSEWLGMSKVIVEFGHNPLQALAVGTNCIQLPERAWIEHIVLHELAHLATFDIDDDEWHGPVFAKEYMRLVKWKMGHEVWCELWNWYRKLNIVY